MYYARRLIKIPSEYKGWRKEIDKGQIERERNRQNDMIKNKKEIWSWSVMKWKGYEYDNLFFFLFTSDNLIPTNMDILNYVHLYGV